MTAPLRSDRTHLRSYAGEQGVPFRFPADEHDGEPASLVDNWPFLVSGLLIAVGIFAARAWGLIT